MDFTGRPIRTMVYVARQGIVADSALRRCVEGAVEYVRALPPKP
jgi:hypothetical protein